MNELDLDIQSLNIQCERILRSIEEVKKQQNKLAQYKEELPAWINIEQAAKLKGGGALETYKTNTFLQPCCGSNSSRVLGRKCWRREDVIEWLLVDDSLLEEYAKKCGVPVPEKYMKMK